MNGFSMNIQINKSLFLRQSYMDAWSDYQWSLVCAQFICWDYIILTASNEDQAEIYRRQIALRQDKGLLPAKTHFAVLSDPNGLRVGSGGATLTALRYIAEQENRTDYFSNLRILVIHSGGDSKRVPQYSACGKLFSPVPRELPNGQRSTLFDELIICMSGVPSRIREGMLVLSGDVLLLFNPLQIDFSNEDAAAISFKEDVQVAKNHGVYLMDDSGNVGTFFHKQTVDTLRVNGAVNKQNMVDIDTGAVVFSTHLLRTLYSLISTDGHPDQHKLSTYINDRVRLSLYGDFLYPLASNSTLEQYLKEAPEGDLTPELLSCRHTVWNALHKYRMKLLRLSPAAFVHFGTTQELQKLMTSGVHSRSYLDWSTNVSCNLSTPPCSVHNVVLQEGVHAGTDCYFENSFVQGDCNIGKNTILSGVTVRNRNIPCDVVLHALKLKNGRFVVRLYGINDNPKSTLSDNSQFLNHNLSDFLKTNSLTEEDVWDTSDHSLWMARLYPSCKTIEDALDAALNIYAMSEGHGDVDLWKRANRESLYSSFSAADPGALIEWSDWLQKIVKIEKMLQIIKQNGSVEDAKLIFSNKGVAPEAIKWAEDKIPQTAWIDRMRMYHFIGKIIGGADGEVYLSKSLSVLREGILLEAQKSIPDITNYKITKNNVTVQLPLRVNFGGGWSDTPPHCIEHGGTVLNAAISVNNVLPVEVKIEKLEQLSVKLATTDLGVEEDFTEIEELQKCCDPYDPYSLHKAALLATGVLPRQGGNLSKRLQQLGGGLSLTTRVIGIPKGSGLGTSSILAGACIKAIAEFFNLEWNSNTQYERALCMEQLMSTGGGWQDQVGGMSDGIKFIVSEPGLQQNLRVDYVNISEQTKQELSERFALIYTGQRRLARNLLRDVVGRYVGNNPSALEALVEIQRLAVLMRFELERGNVDAFAELLNQHWEWSKKLDAGSSNTCIELIFHSIEDLIAGKMICGAGGGGFLQVITKQGVTKQMLHERLHGVFQDCGVDMWDCALL